MFRRLATGFRFQTLGATQWAPTLTVHNPNPPITLESPPAVADEGLPTNSAMSSDVCVEGYAQTVEYYATDDIQGTQCSPLEEAPPEATIVNTAVPDYLVDEMFEPGVFWFQTGPPTSLDDETGQTRGQTCVPDYLEPDAQLDPSDVDWQNPTTQNDATCTSPTIIGNATGGNAASTTHTINLPAASVGDAYLALVTWDTTGVVPTFPAGWSVITFWTSTALTQNFSSAVLWRVVDGTEGATAAVATVGSLDSSIICYAIASADPFTAPVFVNDLTSGNGQNPVSITIPWADPSLVFGVMWQQLDEGELTYPANLPAGRRYHETSNATGAVQSAAAQTSASSFDPVSFSAPAGSTTVSTIAVRGYCADNLNTDPAGCSVPSELEPEAELLQDGWQHGFAALDNPLSEPNDDITGISVPDWLEPGAEPNPEDIGSGGWSLGATDDGIVCYAPVVESVAIDTSSAAGTVHLITMPSGIVAGDKLVMFLWTDGGANVTALTGWTRIGSSLAAEAKLYVRVADGTEGATQTVTFSASVRQAAIVYRISTLYPDADWYQLATDLTNDAGSPSITHTYSTGVYLTLASSLQHGAVKTALGGFTNIQTGDTDAGVGSFGAVAQRLSSEQTVTPGAWSPNNNGDTFYTLVIPGLCIGERYETGTQWTAVTEPPEDVFEESPEWVKTPQQDFEGDNDPAPRYLPDHMALEDEPLQDGWQQSVTVEDFPLDPEIPLTSIPANLEPEAEVDTEGWRCAPLHDFPDNADINNRAVPDELEPEAGPDTNGWFSAPLHDTPSTADITGTSVPETVLPDDQVDCDGWAFRLPDMEAAPVAVETPDPGVSVGTLPGVRPRRKWWVENISAEEKKRKRIHGTRWPDLPDVDVPKKFNPRVVTDKTVRPRLDAAQRDWKNRIRKARRADDEIIMAIIAVLLAEDRDD